MRLPALLLAACLAARPSVAAAWGHEGHEVVALVARAELTPAARARLDALLATDSDPLTPHDMPAEATWADAYRGREHRETAEWHFVDTEIDGSADQDAACFGHPAPARPASAGPAHDCVVDKVREFAAEFAAPGTESAERLLALEYLLHFVGDLHQPLHASDNHDRGGNCVPLLLGGSRTQSLHAYWDTAVVEALGTDPARVAAALRARITPALRADWARGDAGMWAREAHGVARTVAYTVGSAPGCVRDVPPVEPPAGYEARARASAALQLQRAGVRLGALLNAALSPGRRPPRPTLRFRAVPRAAAAGRRTPASLACSAQADRDGLHGGERLRFRRACMRAAG